MQAAYDIVKDLGYILLQYDWPDAVFVHSSYADVFPCLTSTDDDTFQVNHWKGFFHAKDHYSRFNTHVTNMTFFNEITELALRSHLYPRSTIEHIVETQKASWTKDPLWIELGIAGSNIRADIRQTAGNELQVVWR